MAIPKTKLHPLNKKLLIILFYKVEILDDTEGVASDIKDLIVLKEAQLLGRESTNARLMPAMPAP